MVQLNLLPLYKNSVFCPTIIRNNWIDIPQRRFYHLHLSLMLDRIYITNCPSLSLNNPFSFYFSILISLLSFLWQGVNSMFQVFLTGNNSEYFTISPTAVQGRADIRMRVAMPLDYEHIRSYSFSVSFKLITFAKEFMFSGAVCLFVFQQDRRKTDWSGVHET